MTARDVERAVRLVEDAGAEASDGPMAMLSLGAVPRRLTPCDEAEAARRASLGRAWSEEARRIDLAALPHDLALGVEVARLTGERMAREEDWFWLVHDPMRLGFFGLFGPTAYCGAWHLNTITGLVARQPLSSSGDLHRFLALASDLAGVVNAMRLRLEGQAARGILMPAAQLAKARALTTALAACVRATLAAHGEQAPGGDGRFAAELRAVVDGPLKAAFDGLARCVHSLEPPSGEAVGIGGYPAGADVYRELVRLHTTLDMAPEDVHAAGHDRMAAIRESMRELRAEVGFAGDDAEYAARIAADPAWRASGADGVAAPFRAALRRAEPWLEIWFARLPRTRYDVGALPDELRAMTFGFYQASGPDGPPARYLFNAANLEQSGLSRAAAIAFHELVPGHHVHLAGQSESAWLPALRRHASFNAFNEGWAEYAAALAGEHGLYAAPEERFGRMTMDAFLTARLVVDTGMNALGWSLGRARAYMAENAFMPAAEIETETLRYACDMPGQALAYKLGDAFLLAERERMRAALGDRFDPRDFHDAVLAPGALPLPLVRRNIDRAIARLNPG